MPIKDAKIKEIFGPSMTNVIVGMKGAGKTNYAVVLMEMLVSLGCHVYTNIHFFDIDDVEQAIKDGLLLPGIPYRKKPDEIHVITTEHELLQGIVGKGWKVFILDEAGIHASSSIALAKGTVSMKFLAQISRHMRTCMVLITQTKGSIPPDLREKLCNYRIKATVDKKGNHSIEFGEREEKEDENGKEIIDFHTVKGYQNVPHAIYPYDSNAPTGFEIDIDLRKVMNELSKLKSSIDVIREGPDVVKRLWEETTGGGDGKPITKKQLVIDKLRMHPDETQTAISILCSCTKQYVHDIIKAEKKKIVSK